MWQQMLKNVSIVFLLIILVNLSGCFAEDGKHTEENPAGFFYGLLHGMLFTIALVVKFFNSEIQVYETYSTIWYHLGFSLPFGIYFLVNWIVKVAKSEVSS